MLIKNFAFSINAYKLNCDMQPLALVFYERVMPGSQLPTKLESLGYRVTVVNSTKDLFAAIKSLKPFIIIADLATKDKDICPIISLVRQDPETQYIPIIAIADSSDKRLELTAREAGANLVVSEAAILMHLKPLLDQAIAID